MSSPCPLTETAPATVHPPNAESAITHMPKLTVALDPYVFNHPLESVPSGSYRHVVIRLAPVPLGVCPVTKTYSSPLTEIMREGSFASVDAESRRCQS
jgi:hypothetical protein